MGKILIIKGATYTEPTTPSTPDTPSAPSTQIVNLGDISENGYIDLNGIVVPYSDSYGNSNWGYTDYISIPDSAVEISGKICTFASLVAAISFYDSDKQLISCVSELTQVDNSNNGAAYGTIAALIPSNAKYLRLSFPMFDKVLNPPSEYLPPLQFLWGKELRLISRVL